MTAIDFAGIADKVQVLCSSFADQTDQMDKNPRMPRAEIEKRRGQLPLMRQAVRVARALAGSPDAQDIIVERVGGNDA